MHSLESIPDVCDIEIVSAPGARPSSRPAVLIEVPHGATRRRHFEAAARRLQGDYPEYLQEFFYVNTDVGSIECARWIARMLTDPEAHPELASFHGATGHGSGFEQVLIVRGLVPRTFIDLNRVIDSRAPAASSAASSEPGGDGTRYEVTPGLPAYVTDPRDIETLRRMHRDYQAVASRAYELVLDAASDPAAAALILHTYAPRKVEIDRLDGSTLDALRRAYQPDVFATLARRPDVDLITESDDGAHLAPEPLAGLIRENYTHIGIEAAENATYRLHDATLGYVHSAKYPGRVLCLEISRALLAEPFTPFEEMSIGEPNARRMSAPIAAAFLRQEME